MLTRSALLVAHAAVKAAEFVGWPECRINLAQAAVYMALAPKSNAAIIAIDRALAEVREGPARTVPGHLRDGHYPGAKPLGRGVGYVYPHDQPAEGRAQQYLPDGIERGAFWRPGHNGWEARAGDDDADAVEDGSSQRR
jgi:putative ATPase